MRKHLIALMFHCIIITKQQSKQTMETGIGLVEGAEVRQGCIISPFLFNFCSKVFLDEGDS